MVQTINYKGFGFNKYIAIIETFFDSVPGIRIERISVDSIELNIKRNFPIHKLNKLVFELVDNLKIIHDGKLCTVSDE